MDASGFDLMLNGWPGTESNHWHADFQSARANVLSHWLFHSPAVGIVGMLPEAAYT